MQFKRQKMKLSRALEGAVNFSMLLLLPPVTVISDGFGTYGSVHGNRIGSLDHKEVSLYHLLLQQSPFLNCAGIIEHR